MATGLPPQRHEMSRASAAPLGSMGFAGWLKSDPMILRARYNAGRRTAVSVQPARRLFTVEEYHRMGEAGILGPEDRVELIEGEIVRMSPIGHGHAFTVMMLNNVLVKAVGDRALVSPGNPVRLTRHTEPQPDLMLLEPHVDYRHVTFVGPEHVLLVVRSEEHT